MTAAFISYMTSTVLPMFDVWLAVLLPAFLGVAYLTDLTRSAGSTTPPT